MNSLTNSRQNHWAQINEFTFVAGIRFLFWICKIFGRWPFRIFLYPVLAWYILTKPVARGASRDYLHRISLARKETVKSPSLFRILTHFAAFGESILDKLLLWNNLYPTDKVVLYGNEPLNNYIEQGQGCLLICAHFGNLELCKVLSQTKTGLKINILVHTRHAESFNRLLKQISPDSQLNLMQVTKISPATVLLLSEKIKQGEFVIIAGDRIPVSPNPRTVSACFLNSPALFPIGPYVLGSLLQCPVYLMFAMQNHSTPEIHFEPFSKLIKLPRKNREKILSELATSFANHLEHYCLNAPLQWFNFYYFWQIPSHK